MSVIAPQTFYYPPNTTIVSKAEIILHEPVYFKGLVNTGNSMSLGLPTSDLSKGSEIAAFSESGLIVGSTVVNSEFSALTLWGNDELTDEIDGLLLNEEFQLKIWNSETMLEQSLLIEEWVEGNNRYNINKISIAGNFSMSYNSADGFNLYQNTPNPFSNETEFKFHLPVNTMVELSIYNILGELKEIILNEELKKGDHSLIYNSKNLSSGTYYYSLKTPVNVITKQMVIVK